jgi:two-component system, sensor histidine kinase and response regulator
MKGDRERCLAAGMDGYVSKPVSSQELEKTIAGVLLAQGDREAVSSLLVKPADAAEPKGPSVMVWDMDDTMERLGGDEQLFHEVIEIFLDDVPKHMAALGQAIADGNTEAIERLAHTLKGELGYLGISEISRKAREMEELGKKSDVRLAASLYETFEPELCELLISMRRMVGAKPGVEMVAGWPEAGQ